jgi:hypothetical protein
MKSEATQLARSKEQLFLDWFSSGFRGKGLQSRFAFDNLSSYCVSFSDDFHGRNLAGHGYDSDPSVAAFKGAVELMERKAVAEYFRRNPAEPLQNSSGCAVHFSAEAAAVAASREALERHILLYTYLRSGWAEFVLLERKVSHQGEVSLLISPYVCNGHFAGLAIYRDHRFPGVSLGHFADKVENLQDSTRWEHAIFEAVAFVERGLETGGFPEHFSNGIYEECRYWLLEPWQERIWKSRLEIRDIAPARIDLFCDQIANLVPCLDGFQFARAVSQDLIPLFFGADLQDPTRREFVCRTLSRHGLELSSGRHPIL